MNIYAADGWDGKGTVAASKCRDPLLKLCSSPDEARLKAVKLFLARGKHSLDTKLLVEDVTTAPPPIWFMADGNLSDEEVVALAVSRGAEDKDDLTVIRQLTLGGDPQKVVKMLCPVFAAFEYEVNAG